MRAWYLMLGCLVCAGLAPQARGATYSFGCGVGESITTPAPLGSPPWMIGTFTGSDADPNAATLTLNAYLSTLDPNVNQFVSDIAFCVPEQILATLSIEQLPLGAPNAPVANPVVVSPIAAQENLPAMKGFDVKITWPTSNNANRYSDAYDGVDVKFQLTWSAASGFSTADFFNALEDQSNDWGAGKQSTWPNNNSGRYFMGAHVQGMADGKSATIVNTNSSLPEPGTWALAGLGVLGLVYHRGRGRRRSTASQG